MKETVCILSLPAESRGLGGSPMTRKIQKITPEWQSEPFFCSVGSAVARVKGKHHDGDVNKLGGILHADGLCSEYLCKIPRVVQP